jgi:hypothetical protein
MRTSSAKAKGRRLQQAVAAAFMSEWDHLESGDVRSAPMGTSGIDVPLSPAAAREIPFDTECKNVEALNVWKAIKQAEANTGPGRVPLVVFSKNREGIHAALPFDTLIKLCHFARLGLPPGESLPSMLAS